MQCGNLGARRFGQGCAPKQRRDLDGIRGGVQSADSFAAVGGGAPAKPDAKNEDESENKDYRSEHIPTRRRRPPRHRRRRDDVVETIETGSLLVHARVCGMSTISGQNWDDCSLHPSSSSLVIVLVLILLRLRER